MFGYKTMGGGLRCDQPLMPKCLEKSRYIDERSLDCYVIAANRIGDSPPSSRSPSRSMGVFDVACA